jgi:hypothetical protein
VDLPWYKDDVFVAAISDLQENGFRLLEVYQQQKKSLNTSFDFVQPGRYIAIIPLYMPKMILIFRNNYVESMTFE